MSSPAIRQLMDGPYRATGVHNISAEEDRDYIETDVPSVIENLAEAAGLWERRRNRLVAELQQEAWEVFMRYSSMRKKLGNRGAVTSPESRRTLNRILRELERLMEPRDEFGEVYLAHRELLERIPISPYTGHISDKLNAKIERELEQAANATRPSYERAVRLKKEIEESLQKPELAAVHSKHMMVFFEEELIRSKGDRRGELGEIVQRLTAEGVDLDLIQAVLGDAELPNHLMDQWDAESDEDYQDMGSDRHELLERVRGLERVFPLRIYPDEESEMWNCSVNGGSAFR